MAEKEEVSEVERKEMDADKFEGQSDPDTESLSDKNSETSELSHSKRLSKRKQRFPTKQTLELIKVPAVVKQNKTDMTEQSVKQDSEVKSQREQKSEDVEQPANKSKTEEITPRRSSRTPKKKKMFDELDEPEVKPPTKRSKPMVIKVAKRKSGGITVTPDKGFDRCETNNKKDSTVKLEENNISKLDRGNAVKDSMSNNAKKTKKNRDKETELSSIQAEIEQIQASETKVDGTETDDHPVVNEEHKLAIDDEENIEIKKERVLENVTEKGDAGEMADKDDADKVADLEEESEAVESDTLADDRKNKENEDVNNKTVKQSQKSIQCTACEKTVLSYKALRHHERVVHDFMRDTFECTDCEMVLKSKTAFDRHKLVHSEKSYKCYECDLSFVSISKLKRHVKATHKGEFVLKCHYENCDKMFSSLSNRKKHVDAVHLNLRNHMCTYCTKMFKNSSALRVHLLSRHKEHFANRPSFECNVCHKAFNQRLKLRMHESVHTAARPYKCKYEDCVKTFRLKSNKIKHEKVHENIRPYVCPTCGQAFSRRIYLDTHQYKHTGVKKFKCSICSKTFSQKGNLNIHMKIHSDNRDFVSCEKCGKSFSNKSNLTKHKQTICFNEGGKKNEGKPRHVRIGDLETGSDTVLIQSLDGRRSSPISFILREVHDSETNDTVVIIQDKNSDGKMLDKACSTDEIRALKFQPQKRGENIADITIKPLLANKITPETGTQSEIVTVKPPSKPDIQTSVNKTGIQSLTNNVQIMKYPDQVLSQAQIIKNVHDYASRVISLPSQVVSEASEQFTAQNGSQTSQAGEQTPVEEITEVVENVTKAQMIYVEQPTAGGIQTATQQQTVEQVDKEQPVTILTTDSSGNPPTGTAANLADIVLPNAENVEYEIVSSGLDGIEEGILKEFLSKWNQQGTTSGTTVILDVQNRDGSEGTEVQGVTVPDSVQYIVTVKDQE